MIYRKQARIEEKGGRFFVFKSSFCPSLHDHVGQMNVGCTSCSVRCVGTARAYAPHVREAETGK